MIYTISKKENKKLSENFNSREAHCKGKGCCSKTKYDGDLVAILQRIRDHFQKPVYINSWFRCPTHNKKVGGGSASYHLTGRAADIRVDGIDPLVVAQYAESIGVLGIGLYDNFVHVDTRSKKFYWKGHDEKPVAGFGGVVETPALKMTDEEFSLLMARWISAQAGKEPNEWSEDARRWAEENDIIKGTGAGMSYLAPATREQVISFLFQFFNSLQK